MAEETVHLALFKEDSLDAVTEALNHLRAMGIAEADMSVISGIPYSERMLGRPMAWTRVGLMGLGGAVVGVIISLALNLGTPLLYPITVGGMPLLAIPPTIVLTFELGMLGLMLSTFLGVLLETLTPSYGPKGYHPAVTDGKIAILFNCPSELDERMHTELMQIGAELVHRSEVKQ